MRFGYITEGLPYPLTSGRLRHHHLLRHLQGRCDVKLICVTTRDADAEARERLGRIAAELDVVTAPDLEAASRPRRRRARAEVRARLARSTADFGARALLAASGLPIACLPVEVAPLAVDFCDAEWWKLLARARLSPFPDSLRLAVRSLRVRRYERRLAHLARHAFFAGPDDAPHVMGRSATPCTLLPNGIDGDEWKRTGPLPEAPTVLYAGAFSYFPNVDAASLLATRIHPRIRRQVPDVRLLLVGRDPPESLRALHDPPRVTVTGLVPDIRPYYESASVLVAPLRVAGGIQNKLLEGLAMEVPVVTTPQGFAGLGLSADEISGRGCEIAVADSPEALADAAVAAIERHRQDRSPVAANRALVLRRFSWQAAADRLRSVLEGLGAG